MLIFLYGLDAYRLKQARQNIIKEYQKKHSSGVNIFNLDLSEDGALDKLTETVKSSSFFNEHKLVVLTGAFNKKTVAGQVSDILNNYNIFSVPDITLLFA